MIRAEHVEADMLALLKQITLPPSMVDTVVREAETLVAALHAPPSGDSAVEIEAKLKRLGRAYTDGVIDDTEYQRTRDALRLQLQATQPYQPNTFARDMAQTLLQDLPALLDAATAHERRLVLRSLFSEIWVRNGEICELTPRPDVYPLIHVRCAGCVWGG